jgi:hypothetical protein
MADIDTVATLDTRPLVNRTLAHAFPRLRVCTNSRETDFYESCFKPNDFFMNHILQQIFGQRSNIA